jgi:hypothetical protein
MSLRLSRPPSHLIEAFEDKRQHDVSFMMALSNLVKLQEIQPDIRIPKKMWFMGGVPVEGLKRNISINNDFLNNLEFRCWKFFVGLDNGGYIVSDFINETIQNVKYIAPEKDVLMKSMIKTIMLWSHQTNGNNELKIIEIPLVKSYAIKADGPDKGYLIHELWKNGMKDAPMSEIVFITQVVSRYKQIKEWATNLD